MEIRFVHCVLLLIITLLRIASSHSLYDYTTAKEAKQTLVFYSDLKHWVAGLDMKFKGMVQIADTSLSCIVAKAKPIWGLPDMGDGYIYTEIFLPGIPSEAILEMFTNDVKFLKINSIATNCFSFMMLKTCDVLEFLQIGFNTLLFTVSGD